MRLQDGVTELLERPFADDSVVAAAGVELPDEHDAESRPRLAQSLRESVGVQVALVDDDDVGRVPMCETLGAAQPLRQPDEQAGPGKQESRQLEEARIRRCDQNAYDCGAVYRASPWGALERALEGIPTACASSSHQRTVALDLSVGPPTETAVKGVL
jgi:hypothetical protein